MSTPYRYVPVISDVYRHAKRRYLTLRYAGDDVVCPVCSRGWKASKPGKVCPACGSQTRQKAAHLWVKEVLETVEHPQDTLLFAPDPGIEAWLRGHPKITLTTTDYSAPHVDFHWDITDIPSPAGRYDLILCSHVMEHIPDDGKAFRELARILRPDGQLLIQVPFARDTPETDEDPNVTDPAERERRWGQFDHVRKYGQDITARMQAAGLACEVRPLDSWISASDMARYELWNDVIFVCRKLQ